ncbi:hypothetical protein L3C95_29920 [Chitinophaga filiformis]|uniref:hypothetical protein n=1 Tax=Chitinophaga filiformis TaxID=104663 RepID=UPI001F25A7FC|nr:hypothetical protein [Chitinophaga filiformis]MCF6407151.1 hypothetical protein [Chitinophaga filiformis]
MYTRKTILLLFTALLGLKLSVSAQYYYQDIVNTARTEANMALLKENKITVQLVQSFDAGQESDNDFRCQREILANYRQIRSTTVSRATGYSVMTSYFSTKGKLTKTVDSTRSVITTVIYMRNTNDTSAKIREVYLTSYEPKSKYKFTETRRYQYDSLGRLSKMIHFHGDKIEDSTTVQFTLDSLGLVAEEMESGKGASGRRIYYKYNDQNLLTDIVRYSPTRKKMLPDYIFDYDAKNRIGAMTTVNGETATYTIWRYTYDERGLPIQEECYGKKKELLGTVRYKYRK